MILLLFKKFFFLVKGSEKSKFKEGCALFSVAQSETPKFSRNDAERLFRCLLLKGVLQEYLVTGPHGNIIAYLTLGSKAGDIEKDKMTVSWFLFSEVQIIHESRLSMLTIIDLFFLQEQRYSVALYLSLH